jgi:hypothetical protein
MTSALRWFGRTVRAYWWIYLPLWALCLGAGYLTGHR